MPVSSHELAMASLRLIAHEAVHHLMSMGLHYYYYYYYYYYY